MKLSSLLALLALNAGALANPVFADDIIPKMPPAAADKAWSVAGTWHFMHTVWSGMKTLAPDGSIMDGGKRTEDRWMLETRQGEVHLIIRWRDWSADDLAMINANEFYGNDGRSELRLRRLPPASVSTDGREFSGPVEIHSWYQGEPPVKLIRQDEGFCALTSVTGRFMGSGETVRVYVADDGYWYLGGTSAQEHVSGQCVVVRFRAK